MVQTTPSSVGNLALKSDDAYGGASYEEVPRPQGQQSRKLYALPGIPPAPESVAELGIPERFLEDLLLKTLHRLDTTTTGLATAMRISPMVLRALLESLKRQRLVETTAGSGRLEREWKYRLTEPGMRETENAFARSRYVGPVPVPIHEYFAALEEDESVGLVDPGSLARSLQQLVLSRETVAKICLGLTSGRPSILWGPPGNGKTTVLQFCGDALVGSTLLPVSVFVSGHVIALYDERTHVILDPDEGNDPNQAGDRRWLRVRRPFVFVGGELRPEDLDLAYDASTGAHQAPPHMRAHGGLLAIDDFGRQQVAPAALLNRWIAALERGDDTVSLVTGERISFPFRCAICFSTNLEPRSMLDEAHLRRVPYKVLLPEPSPAQMAEIFRRFARAMNVEADPKGIAASVRLVDRASEGRLRSCHPRDMLQLVVEEAHFLGESPTLEPEAVRRACELYFGLDPGPDDWEAEHTPEPTPQYRS